jgi:hypothetical protein
MGTGKRGTKLHASVAGSRVTAFLATAAPWEPYFTDNTRINDLPKIINKNNNNKVLFADDTSIIVTDINKLHF